MEVVVPLEAAAEAVEGLAGLPDPEPYRVEGLPEAGHLLPHPGGDVGGGARNRGEFAASLTLRDLEEWRGEEEGIGDDEETEAVEWGHGLSLGFPPPLEQLTVLPLPLWTATHWPICGPVNIPARTNVWARI